MPSSREDQITIEKTPKYLVDKRVPERAFKLNPNLKLIVVMRNPVVRAISEYVQSQWRHKKFNHRTNPKQALNDSQRFEQMAYKEMRNHTQTIRSDWAIIRNGIYSTHLKPWLAQFPKEQFLFVNGEELIKSPSSELNRVEKFLGLESVIRQEHFVLDRRKGFACIIKPIDSKQVKCLSDQKGRKHPKIDAKILNDLREFYKPFSKQLFEIIEQEPWWEI